MVTINGTTYNGHLVDMGKTVGVEIYDEITFAECAEFGDTPTLSDDKTTISAASKLFMICVSDEGRTNCQWLCQTDAEKIAEELEHKKAELAEAEMERDDFMSRVAAVREAIKDFGTGIPTLGKLTAFLSAVKEAVHYDGNNNED